MVSADGLVLAKSTLSDMSSGRVFAAPGTGGQIHYLPRGAEVRAC